jgi:hypothetical protein
MSRRLDPLTDKKPSGSTESHLFDFFERPDIDWDSPYFLEVGPKQDDVSDRRHLVSLFEKLRRGMNDELVAGVRTEAQARDLVRMVSFPEHPVLEKLCILYVFQRWFRSAHVADSASFIREQAVAKLSGTKNKKFDEFVDKHKSDMIAQWLRENNQKQVYAGLENFIPMSEGLPRALITVLKHVYDWATYTGEDPFRLGKISLSSQNRGVTEAADLFLEQMLPDGEDGVRVGSAIERLCTLFRTNRFSDKPVETSLIAFSVDQLALAGEARDLLDLATKTSLIIGIDGGQRERNSMSVTNKYEINRMLSPRRDLPIARRGIVSFDTKTVESIFIEGKKIEFDAFAKAWVDKMTAPGFGRASNQKKRSTVAEPDFFDGQRIQHFLQGRTAYHRAVLGKQMGCFRIGVQFQRASTFSVRPHCRIT